MKTILQYLDEIKQHCSEVSFLSMEHYIKKLYKDLQQEISKDEFISQISNYPQLNRYLNDFASMIYKKNNSSINEIYMEVCKYFDVDTDNKYVFEFFLKKLQLHDASDILAIKDESIKKQYILSLEEKLQAIKQTKYYKDNTTHLAKQINKIENTIQTVITILQ